MKTNSACAALLCSVIFAFGAVAFGQEQGQTPAPAAASLAVGTSVPRLVNFSGVIKDGVGKPVTGPVPVTFSLYAEPEGGTPLWSETQNLQPDAEGKYSVFLGAASPTGLPLDLFTKGAARWLAVQPGVPGVEDLSRILLVGVPYALKAADADTLGGKPLSAFVTKDSPTSSAPAGKAAATSSTAVKGASSQTANAAPASVGGSGTTNFIPLWTNSTTLGNSVLFQSAGNVGLGTMAPGARLEVDGTGAGIKGITTGANNAVWGYATAGSGLATGVLGSSSSTGGVGVWGGELATSGNTIGVQGKVHSSAGVAGVFDNIAGGEILSGRNNGVKLFTLSSSAGVLGTFTPTKAGAIALSGTGGIANNNGTGGTGVVGVGGAGPTSNSQSGNGGTGVTAMGAAGPASGNGSGGAGVIAMGGRAFNFSSGTPAGPGVMATGGTGDDCCAGDGVEAYGGSFEGVGVLATGGSGREFENGFPGVVGMGGLGGGASNGPGVAAHGGSESGNGGGDGIDAFAGVPGSGFSNGLAGSFTGDVSVSGNLTVSGTKSFRIDHPLDPANKYLYHASIESSEVLNLYSGNVTLDARGEASVQLPDWFETLNKDFRYQLTAVGGAAPNLHIASKIQDHQFRIAGGDSGLEVSWQVTGVRQDAWEKAHPMIVETAKPQNEKGYYLSPELFGAPVEKSIDWARYPKMMKRMKDEQKKEAMRAQAQRRRP